MSLPKPDMHIYLSPEEDALIRELAMLEGDDTTHGVLATRWVRDMLKIKGAGLQAVLDKRKREAGKHE